MTKVEMNIEGMHCGGCATGIQMVTEQMDGVSSSFVDLDGKKGTFEYDESKVTNEQIIAEIKKLGYEATVAVQYMDPVRDHDEEIRLSNMIEVITRYITAGTRNKLVTYL